MTSTHEALTKVETYTKPLNTSNQPLSKSIHHILAEDVLSPINMPPFRQSAMDGYALNMHDSNTYNFIGEIKAGDNNHPELKQGEAVRIFTGAAVPDTANAVIMQEKVVASNKHITIEDTVTENKNIRPFGEQVKKDSIALKKGTVLNPAAIGFLTTLGITEVKVYQKPKIAIVTTGNELVEAGQPLQYGQIYESNSLMLQSALETLGYDNVTPHKVADDYDSTQNLLENVIATNDLVLITGGISVGDYDFVGKALNTLNVEQVFYKVKQKPGKPLFFGKKENTSIFALPGNPAASLSCFYIYVRTALERLSGNTNYQLPKTIKKSATSYTKKGDRAQFLKAIIKEDIVEILDGQSSAMLQTFALANALAFVPEDIFEINVGDDIEVIQI